MTKASSSIDKFIEILADLRFEDTFNPYAHFCPNHDTRNAAAIRRNNLKLVLQAALTKEIDSLWVARDLGYRGGRRTGLALTDECHLNWHAELLGTSPLSRATKGPEVGERTATIVWQMLRAIDRPVFLWNVFPLHPHMPDDPMTNRCHTRAEQIACRPLLMWLIETLQPKKVVAIGRDAHSALEMIGLKVNTVRHPSYGGQTEFIDNVASIYGLKVAQAGSLFNINCRSIGKIK